MKRYKQGDYVYFLESNRLVRQAQVIKVCGNRYMIQFLDTKGAIMASEARLYETQEQAESKIPKRHNNVYEEVNTGYQMPELH